MSTSSGQQPPGASGRTGQPSTQEIPVVPPAGAAPAGAAQPTGPVDFVPGLRDAGSPPSTHAPTPPPLPPPPPRSPAAEPGPDAPPTAPVTAEPAAWPASLEQETGPAGKRIRGDRSGDRQALAGLALAVVSVALLEVGLLLRFGSDSFWSTVTLWSAFATVCAALALVAFAAFYPAGNRLRSTAMWRIAAAGLVGLSVFWVLVVLPVVASDRGFVLTAALGCLGAALWIGPRRKG